MAGHNTNLAQSDFMYRKCKKSGVHLYQESMTDSGHLCEYNTEYINCIPDNAEMSQYVQQQQNHKF